MKKLKSNNGITLATLVLTITLILIISGMMGYFTISGLDIQKVNDLYSDIDQIQNKIDEYYIKNNELPLLGENINFNISQNNPNDDSNKYYVIDLSKLGNLRLNYGKDFDSVKNKRSS